MTTTMMMNKANLLLLLVCMAAWWTTAVVEGSYSIGFNVDSNFDTTDKKCTPKQLMKMYKIYDAALIKGGWNDLPEDAKWRNRKNVTIELDILDEECSANPNQPDFILDHLSNDFSVSLITCIPPEGEAERRNLVSSVEFKKEEGRHQGERQLVYCPECILWPQIYGDCLAYGCRRRRNLLRGEEEPGRVRQLGELDKQIVVDTIYELCLKKKLDRCMDCSKATVCDGGATSLTTDDGQCAIPSCQDDKSCL